MLEIFKLFFQMTAWLMKAMFRVTTFLVTQSADALTNHRNGRGARRGVLAPGDPAPPANTTSSFYDYRGALSLRRVPVELQQAAFPLGKFVDPRRGRLQAIGLPAEAVNHNVALIGPAGSGKTTGIIVPWIVAGLRHGYSVVTIDVKGDLLDRVKAEARVPGVAPLGVRALSLDYTRPAASFGWSWLAELDSDRAIDQAVASILGHQAPAGTDPFFFNLDAQVLRGLLELVSVSPKRGSITTSQLLGLLKDQNRLEAAMAKYPSSAGAARLADLPNLDPVDYTKRITGVAVRLDALAKPTIEAVTNRLDLSATDILASRHLVSVVAPLQDGQMAQMLSSLFVNSLLYRSYDRFTRPGGVPVLLVLDEAAQLADRIDYANVLSVARAARVAVVVAVQDAQQFKDVNQRSVVFANCGTLICLNGVSHQSAEVMSKRVGEHPVQTSTISTGPAASGIGHAQSQTTGTQMAPVLGFREIMAPPFGVRSGSVHARDLWDSPFLIDLDRG
jgi:type IV secretory pathway TraG/TraD family ATPase VirD4